MGRRHGLALINIFDQDARLTEAVPVAYRGLDRFAARDKVVADLDYQNTLVVHGFEAQSSTPEQLAGFLEKDYFSCLRSHGVAHVYNAWSKMPELQTE